VPGYYGTGVNDAVSPMRSFSQCTQFTDYDASTFSKAPHELFIKE